MFLPEGSWRGLAAALTLTVSMSLLVMAGCSSGETTAPEMIEGKTPADYREAAERGVVDSIPTTPKGASKGARRER